MNENNEQNKVNRAKSILEKEGLKFEQLLGEGHFGQVWKAKCPKQKYGTNIQTVAVKFQFNPQKDVAERVSKFLKCLDLYFLFFEKKRNFLCFKGCKIKTLFDYLSLITMQEP